MTKQIRDQLMDFDGDLASPSERERAVRALAEALHKVGAVCMRPTSLCPDPKPGDIHYSYVPHIIEALERDGYELVPASPDTAPSELRAALEEVERWLDDNLRNTPLHSMVRASLAASGIHRAALRGQPTPPSEAPSAPSELRAALEAAIAALDSMDGQPRPGAVRVDPRVIAATLRAALRGQPETPGGAIYCAIHQHYKWCEHNGGVMGETGYEAPRQPETPV